MTTTQKNFKSITTNILKRLNEKNWNYNMFYDNQKKRLYISSEQLPYEKLGEISEDILIKILPETRRVIIHGLNPISTYLNDFIGNRTRLIYKRGVVEIAKKTPSWHLKNILYSRYLRINISDNKTVIIAPNVAMEYIYPEIIEIGTNTVIGEESMILAHLLYPEKIEFGPVIIGNNCLIGVRAIIMPGITIGDGATIGANTLITRDVPSGATVLGSRNCLLLQEPI